MLYVQKGPSAFPLPPSVSYQNFREDVEEGDIETGPASLPPTSRNIQYDTYTRTIYTAPKTKVTVSSRAAATHTEAVIACSKNQFLWL